MIELMIKDPKILKQKVSEIIRKNKPPDDKNKFQDIFGINADEFSEYFRCKYS